MTKRKIQNDEKKRLAREGQPLKLGGAVSRFLFLNLSFIFATYPPAKSGQPLSAGIFGLAGPWAVP